MTWVCSSVAYVFQASHHDSIELGQTCRRLRTWRSLRSVACRHVSSAKRARWTLRFGWDRLYTNYTG